VDRNIVFERRAAEGHPDPLPWLVDELVANHVDVIITQNYPAAAAAKDRAGKIPIVVTNSGDPVATVDCRLVCLVGHLFEGLGPGQPGHEGPPGTAVHGQSPVHDQERKERRVSRPRAFRLPAPLDRRPRSRRRWSSLAEEIAVYMDPDRPLALNLPEYPVYTSHRYLEWKAYRCIYDNPDIILSSCLKDRI
jgi:hypothetical protein